MSLLQSKHWRFSDDGREFIITRRDLPDPWENRICTDDFSAIIRQDGSGFCYGRCPRNDRVLAEDSPRAVYVRDADTGRHWTVNGVEGKRRQAGWQCRHGFGYTTLASAAEGIEGEVTYFVPLNHPVEVWRIRLTNTTDKARKLSVFSQVHWQLGYVNTPPHNYEVTERNGVIYARALFWPEDSYRTSLPEFNREWDRVAFMASSRKPTGFDCLPEGFLGGGSIEAPQAVVDGKCTGSFGRGGENIGALQHDIRIDAGKAADLVIVIGAAADARGVGTLARRYAEPAKADKALAKGKAWWEAYLKQQAVELPDADISRFANGWLRYALYLRYYLRYGYRDTAQDIGSFFSIDLPRGTQRLKRLFESQLYSGHCMHDVPHFRFPSHVSVNSDKALWLPWVTAEYLRETGDWAWLDRVYSFHDGGAATGYEHLVRSIDYICRQSGRFGLPYIKCGDWNDALAGAYERGVSVWMADFFYIVLGEMVRIAEHTGRAADAERFRNEAKRIARAVNEHCWDGKWYVRGFDSNGKPIGSKSCREGKIFANPQSWAVMGGLAPADRALTAMNSVRDRMETPVGIPMMDPAYSKPDPALGEITRFAPYHHHNGGVWNHMNTWVMLAECRLGRTDRALDLFHKIFPPRLARDIERFTAPPYAYGSWTNTPRSRLYGKADQGWNTGTTPWILRVLMEGFCGVRAGYDGLEIDPRMPTSWPQAKVRRPWHGAVYDIEILNPEGIPAGPVTLELDGRVLEGNVIPPPVTAGEHSVRVTVGA